MNPGISHRERREHREAAAFSGFFALSVVKSVSEKAGQASSLPVHGASSPRVSGGKMPPEPADKMSAPHFRTRSKASLRSFR